MKKIDLKGTFGFILDKEKVGIDRKYYGANTAFSDSLELPATVSTAKKGKPSKEMNTGFLTDPYHYEGYTWYKKTLEFEEVEGKEFFLVLERTRTSHVWVDDNYIGSNNSLCSSHRYCLTPYVSKKHRLTIMIDNTSYPVPGGHMTSLDTQTNWNGITGEIYIEECNKEYLTGIKIYPNAAKRLIEVKVTLHGLLTSQLMGEKLTDTQLDNVQLMGEQQKESQESNYYLIATVLSSDYKKEFLKSKYQLQEGENTFTYYLNENIETWSEHTPKLYQLHLELKKDNDIIVEEYEVSFGLRDFKAAGKYFEINGVRTFLRGKHDGLIFPMTGHAPTDLDSWLNVLGIAKQYGINHYRFHTCCPPDAAFTAADILGIYMEPELPFWGTVTEEGEKNHDEKAQEYLIKEGYRILDEFGNHPSFVMMSLGNELWGSKKRLNQILGDYRTYDSRHLYTQGSNNFQFMPCILENEDFFCGVRLSKERLFRGSYAMCDAPQGHIQMMRPNSIHSYDQMIRPTDVQEEAGTGGEITIQYGTGTKTVKVDASKELIPDIPVVSHEIGQFAMYPDFTEITKYTGVLKARNFEVFKERLKDKGMLHMAEKFFKASGRLAADCYKVEVETALKSNELAGFQVLDLQDFTGQGTALIGILNSFMESKGLISPRKWQQFCSDTVLLAELPKFDYKTGEIVDIGVKLSVFHPKAIVNPKVELTITDKEEILLSKEVTLHNEYYSGVFHLCEFQIRLPELYMPKELTLTVKISDTDIKNQYEIWVYPEKMVQEIDENIVITESITKACESLTNGKNVLLYPESLEDTNSIEGTYCTDFWCYGMFRAISESMGKPVPIGTLGLLIEHEHPMFEDFPTKDYTTAQWYDIVTNSRALILDEYEIKPIVSFIDNFERNHKLGIVFELKIGEGKLIVCTSNLRKLTKSEPAKWLEYSILKYMSSKVFKPGLEIEMDELNKIIR